MLMTDDAEDDEVEEVVIHDKTENASNNATIRRPPHPPPIFVQNVECIAVLQNALTAISNYKYSLRIARNNEVMF